MRGLFNIMSSICNHRWWASRIEVRDSVPVLHVCVEPARSVDHPVGPGLARRLHRCACGAMLGGDGGAYGHAGSRPTWSEGWGRALG